MKFINTKTFATSLVVLSTLAISTSSNAQYLPHHCQGDRNISQIDDLTQNNHLSVPCIQDAGETIYNPIAPMKHHL